MNHQAKGTRKRRAAVKADEAKVDLIAVVVAVTDSDPCLLTIGNADTLPSGPYALEHRSLQSGLRGWVEQQTGHPLGYIEQLYTFADRDRIGAERQERAISISYLALTRKEQAAGSGNCGWRSWYEYLPWEDHRSGTPVVLDILRPRLSEWAEGASDPTTRRERLQRAAIAFGFDHRNWNEELTLQRYELLYESALIEEAGRGRDVAPAVTSGKAMIADHRRILATGIARLRSKIKYGR